MSIPRITYRLPHGAREDIEPMIRRIVLSYAAGDLVTDTSDIGWVERLDLDMRTLRSMVEGSYKVV
jgi:hypothetical protein